MFFSRGEEERITSPLPLLIGYNQAQTISELGLIANV